MTLTCQKVAARKALSSKLYHPAVLGYSYTTEAATQEIHGPQPSPPLEAQPAPRALGPSWGTKAANRAQHDAHAIGTLPRPS